jgi:hypothetical protein
MHVKLTNGQPEKYSIGQLRRDNPQVSFPKSIPDALLASYDVYPLTPVDRPVADHTKNVNEGKPQQINGTWTQVWDITDASAAEIETRTQEMARSVRSERDYMLQQTDWIVIMHTEKGTNIPAVWEIYRQSLRDITSQPGFPHNVTWPTKPE